MPDYTQYTTSELIRQLNDFERRIRALETAPRAGYTTLSQNSKIQISDTNGIIRLIIGATADGGDVGMWVFNAAGVQVGYIGTDGNDSNIVLHSGDDANIVFGIASNTGWAIPQYFIPVWPDPSKTINGTGQSITLSATYEALFNGDFIAVARNITGSLLATVPAGTTADVKITATCVGMTD